MYEFDKRLCALADCPVIEEKGGAMLFDPSPIITAENDLYLAHEICHVLAGRRDYEIFYTSVQVRDNSEIFKHVLNVLYDWYHESTYGQYSGFLYGKLNDLHKTLKYSPIGIPILDYLYKGYLSRVPVVKIIDIEVKDVIDLIVISDHIVEDILPKQLIKLNLSLYDITSRIYLPMLGKNGGPKSDIGLIPKKSNYYISTVSRYFHMIKELSNLWKKNKHCWVNNYYGEIDWKDLPSMFVGEKINLPVWRLFQKIAIYRKIYLVVDRSGSTYSIKDSIMSTAIIIAESLRMLNIPISVLDVGITNSVINDIKTQLDTSWFTPMDGGGTPLGEVCSLITKADHESYLLIVTDGEPNSWKTLISSLSAFPGKHLTFVIGDSYGAYVKNVRNAIHVEPNTIIREMLNEDTLT